MKKVVEYFQKLVQIDSPSGHEYLMSKYLESWLKKNKFLFKIDKVGNIYAKRGDGKPILFCAHMDTVNPGSGIEPKLIKGFVTSSGNTILGADNKAFIAALLTALEQTDNKKRIEIIFSVKEETGGGIEHLPFHWIKSKDALVFDSAQPIGGIILRSPYIFNFHIVLKGKAAHASLPKKGKNALIPALQILNTIPVGELDSKETTINVGLISGGTGINTVPDTVTISGEVRSYNKKLFEKHLKTIRLLVTKVASKFSVSYKYWQDGYCPGYVFDKSDALIKKVKDVYRSLNINSQLYNHSGISDANILNAKGIKTLNLADGVIDPHTTKEKVSVADLNKLVLIIQKIISGRRTFWGG